MACERPHFGDIDKSGNAQPVRLPDFNIHESDGSMAEIMRARSSGFLGPEFDDFLFATIGADQNGGYLSVVSALARMDLDPWAEAAKLAKLPAEIATQKLSSLIAALQEIPSARQEPRKIAARLVALLPGGLSVKARPKNFPGGKAMTNSRSAFSVFLCAFALLLAFQAVMHFVHPQAPHPVSHIAANPLSANNLGKVAPPRD
jgi:hypothetical protein